MEFVSEQLVAGLVGIGLVAKGIIDHAVNKKKSICACGFTVGRWEKLKLEFERINMKLDHIGEKHD